MGPRHPRALELAGDRGSWARALREDVLEDAVPEAVAQPLERGGLVGAVADALAEGRQGLRLDAEALDREHCALEPLEGPPDLLRESPPLVVERHDPLDDVSQLHGFIRTGRGDGPRIMPQPGEPA